MANRKNDQESGTKGPSNDQHHLEEAIHRLDTINKVMKSELSSRTANYAKEVTLANTHLKMCNDKMAGKDLEIEELQITLESVINSLKAMKIESSSTQITLQTQLQKLNKDIRHKDETIAGLQQKLAQLEATLNELKYNYKVTINSLHNSYTSVTENALRNIIDEVDDRINEFGENVNQLNNDYLARIRKCF